jgi:hypothetical protein
LLLGRVVAHLVAFGLCQNAEKRRIAVRYPMAETEAADEDGDTGEDGVEQIESPHGGQELALPPSINLDQVKGCSLFMMKAVIDGRGSEVIDLLKTNLF